MFYNRDCEPEDPDTELEDLSEVSSMKGIGTPTNGINLTPAQNVEAEEAYLTMKAAQQNIRKHTPRGYRKGVRQLTKTGKQFKSKKGNQFKSKKGKGKGKTDKQFRRTFFNIKFADSRQGEGNRGKTNPSRNKRGNP